MCVCVRPHFLAQMSDANQAQTQPPVRPEFVRFPRNGEREPHTGLTRAFLYSLAKTNEIRTIKLRKRGNNAGVSLIVFDSLIDYITRASQEVA